jgi:hypothetical protein
VFWFLVAVRCRPERRVSNTAQRYGSPTGWEWTTAGPVAKVIHNLPPNPLSMGVPRRLEILLLGIARGKWVSDVRVTQGNFAPGNSTSPGGNVQLRQNYQRGPLDGL